MSDRDTYLKSLIHDTESTGFGGTYVPTDVEGKKPDPGCGPQVPWATELRVQCCRPPKARGEKGGLDKRPETEKRERFKALDGLLKYAAEHVLLKGRPGSGKTTTLRKLLIDLAVKAEHDPQQPVPVLIELKYFRRPLEERIQASLRKHDWLLDTGEIDRGLLRGEFFLLFDGLNELRPGSRESDIRAFRDIHRKHTPMIFATREFGAGGDLGITRTLEMQPLTRPQVEQFVKAYLPKQAQTLLRALKGHVQRLAETPLFLMMLCEEVAPSGAIPPSLGGVFRGFTRKYPSRHSAENAATYSQRDLWPEILSNLAFRMLKGKGPNPKEPWLSVPGGQARAILQEYFSDQQFADPGGKAHDFLRDFLNHHLLQRGPNGTIEFRHQMVQEYYAAEYLLRKVETVADDSLQRDYLNWIKWTEPLAMMANLLDDDNQEQALRVVKLALEVDPVLGARLAGALPVGFHEAAITLVDAVDCSRKSKADLLSLTASDLVIQYLGPLLKESDPNVRQRAVMGLGVIGSEAAVGYLIKALRDPDPWVGGTAAETLGRIGADAAVQALIEARRDTNNLVSSSAAEALRRIGADAAVADLFPALRDRSDWVKSWASIELEKIGADDALARWIEALHDPDFLVRHAAALRLGEMGSNAAITDLIEALQDPSEWVRGAAAEALGQIRSNAAVAHLIIALHDADVSVGREAAEALGRIGSDTAVGDLMNALENPHYWLKSAAAKALGAIGSAAVPAIGQLRGLWLQEGSADCRKAMRTIQRNCGYYAPDFHQPRQVTRSSPPLYLLHLSDVHFSSPADADTHFTRLRIDLEGGDLHVSRIDALVISGDISFQCAEEGYRAAVELIRRIQEKFRLVANHILIVPGNHDLDRKVSKESYASVRIDQVKKEWKDLRLYASEKNPDYVEVPDTEALKSRFALFADFFRQVKGKSYPTDYAKQWDIVTLPDRELLILGLNSAWNTDHHFPDWAEINPSALTAALGKIRDDYRDWEKIVVWHHPLDSPEESRIKGRGFLEQLAQSGFRIILHGHAHQEKESAFSFHTSLNHGKIECIGAGTFGGPPEEVPTGHPWQYNLIVIEGNTVTVYTRQRREQDGAWSPDVRYRNEEGQFVPYYRFPLDPKGDATR